MKLKVGDLVTASALGNVPVFSYLSESLGLIGGNQIGRIGVNSVAIIVAIPDKDHALITNGSMFGFVVIGALVKV